MFFKNLWLKLTNSNEFRAQKFLKIREKAKKEYESKFSSEIEKIHKKIILKNHIKLIEDMINL